MTKWMQILILFVILITSNNVFSAEGCLIGSTTSGTLYTGSYSTTGGAFPYVSRTYSNPTSRFIVCPSQSSSILHGENLVESNYYFWNIPCRIVNSGSYVGTVYTFDLVPCPIDDYVPLILLLTGSLGFFFLRKNYKLHAAN